MHCAIFGFRLGAPQRFHVHVEQQLLLRYWNIYPVDFLLDTMFTLRISLSRRLIILTTTFFFTLYTFYSIAPSLKFSSFSLLHSCSPLDYSEGQWVYSPHTSKMNMTQQEDALEFSGFSGCASSREFFWHLASDREEQWDRFPAAQSWKWVPGENCTGLRPLDARHLVKDLVEDGGWYLVGGESFYLPNSTFGTFLSPQIP